MMVRSLLTWNRCILYSISSIVVLLSRVNTRTVPGTVAVAYSQWYSFCAPYKDLHVVEHQSRWRRGSVRC
uniref:Putative secreted protein n=1 Tax=Anopheles triannulatus TaxID=58253 RepID=A0A2M4B750_9DIPT